MPTVREINEHFLANAPWVDRATTVDTIKVGDPDRAVHTVAVGWMSTIYDLEQAASLGCDLFITHEPTFWEHWAAESKNRRGPGGLEKTELLERTGMAVLRCHDAWDLWPEIGIRPAWARCLGLTTLVEESDDRLYGIYGIAPTTLGDFAAYVLEKVRPLGEKGVQVMGDPGWTVKRPCLGVGCYTPDADMIERGADCIVGNFDGSWYWEKRERFYELGVGAVTLEHGTTENWGMRELADYVRRTWPALTVHHLDLYPRPWYLT